jgi:hypothetical protein
MPMMVVVQGEAMDRCKKRYYDDDREMGSGI